MSATLICLGFGYCARNYVAEFGAQFGHIVGTTRRAAADTVVRGPARPGTAISDHLYGGGPPVEMLAFDGRTATADLRTAIARADAVLISAAPHEAGDPVLAVLDDAFRTAPQIASIVYLSTVGVYGDHAGGWVDERTLAQPTSPRAGARIAAEAAWRALGVRRGTPVAILRLAGIYGPGQNALVNVMSGRARRIAKPGQIFNRIHVADIAQVIDAAFGRTANGIFNVTDDEPTVPGDPIAFAAGLLGVPPPPEVPFDEVRADMAPLAASFYAESRRVRNDKLKRELGVTLRYPTYREGLTALVAGMQTSQRR